MSTKVRNPVNACSLLLLGSSNNQSGALWAYVFLRKKPGIRTSCLGPRSRWIWGPCLQSKSEVVKTNSASTTLWHINLSLFRRTSFALLQFENQKLSTPWGNMANEHQNQSSPKAMSSPFSKTEPRMKQFFLIILSWMRIKRWGESESLFSLRACYLWSSAGI